MVKLNATKPLEGSHKTRGRIVAARPKTIAPGKDQDPNAFEAFPVIELEVGNLQGEIRNVMGNGTLTVALACSNVNHQTQLGILARDVIGWDGKTPLDTDELIGKEIEFQVDPTQGADRVFWNINRRSVGPIGHLDGITIR
jgi:hypothetical protein